MGGKFGEGLEWGLRLTTVEETGELHMGPDKSMDLPFFAGVLYSGELRMGPDKLCSYGYGYTLPISLLTSAYCSRVFRARPLRVLTSCTRHESRSSKNTPSLSLFVFKQGAVRFNLGLNSKRLT